MSRWIITLALALALAGCDRMKRQHEIGYLEGERLNLAAEYRACVRASRTAPRSDMDCSSIMRRLIVLERRLYRMKGIDHYLDP